MKTIITFLVAAACTVLLYHLTFEEHSELFYVNVIATCVAEAILLSGLPLFSNDKLLTFKHAASWTVLNLFAILLFAWTLLYTLVIANGENINTLYVGQLLLGIVFAILLGVTEVGGSAMKQQEEVLQTTIKTKKRALLSVESYWLDAKDSLSGSSDWEDDTLRLLRLVLDKVKSIPAEKLERNSDVMSGIQGKLDEIQSLIDDLSSSESPEKVQQSIQKKLNSLKNYVVTIKATI
ncbi:hypothetical protein [Parabacteroides sp.]